MRLCKYPEYPPAVFSSVSRVSSVSCRITGYGAATVLTAADTVKTAGRVGTVEM